MGLLFSDTPDAPPPQSREVTLLHQLQCQICPLNQEPGRMPPTGSSKPLIYMIGEAPGKTEIEEMEQFVGASGELLRPLIPERFEGRLRWNNVVRSRPPNNRTPETAEIESCRPSVEADIAASKPKAIFGFGAVPLHWVSGFSIISLWRGRRMPVVVAGHPCWFYPMFHPSFLLRNRRNDNPSEDEWMFRLDLKRAFAEIEDLPPVETSIGSWRSAEVENLLSLDEVRAALDEAAEADDLGLDYETSDLRPYDPEALLLSAAVAWGERIIAFPFDHPGAKWTPEERVALDQIWIGFLKKARGRRWVHNLAFELEWTGVRFGADLIRSPKWQDSQSQAAIIDERRGKTKPGAFSLEFLIQLYFGFNLKKLSGLNRKALIRVFLDRVLRYNGLDARGHLELGLAQEAIIESEGLQEAYGLALRRVPTVVASQMAGVPVDFEEVAGLQTKYAGIIAALETRIDADPLVAKFRGRLARQFNPASVTDVLEIFHTMLGYEECLVHDKYSDKVKKSVDEEVLTKIADNHGDPLAKLLVDLRKAARQKSTYIDILDPKSESTVIYPDGLIHAVFNTTFAETGRLSCEDPNLQFFPKRDETAKEVRRPIRSPKGHTMLAVDYGQIEARVIAMFTKDKVFCKALWENYDVHLEWGERLARAYPDRIGGRQMLAGFNLMKDKKNKDREEVKAVKDFRTDIKNQWTFPLFFGASLRSASNFISIPENVLKPLYEDFWDQFSGVKVWQEEQLRFYRRNGYVECLTGRRRRGPLTSNQICNTPVQGTAAEIVMDAMCRLYESGDPERHPEINIHDDFTFVRVPLDRLDTIAEKVIDTMLRVPFKWVNVPISVEASIGPNWCDMEEFGKFSSDKWKWL